MPEGVGYGPQFTASTGLSLNIIGNHAYAQSGPFAQDTNEHTMLEFRMGSSYLVAEISFHGTVNASAPNDGNLTAWQVYFNGSVVFLNKTDSSDENSPHSETLPILIPPYTEVKITGTDFSGGNAGDTAVSITGRIYGKVE